MLNKLAVYGNVEYGNDFRAGRGAIISAPHGLSIGSHVSIGPRSIVQVDGAIGDFVMIGMGVQIVNRVDHAIDELGVPMLWSTWSGDREQTDRDTVTIGTDVWIGGGSVVLSGIRIGDGAVVGAGSVVTRDVDDFSIVGGVPARVLGKRFADDGQRSEHLARLSELLQKKKSSGV
ncbi:DapH/DapD/GlmU-related protein [Rhodococcus sp. As11]|uniref:DapH/DapD/GlmU-related protein n=1 Tax=Rhodococcus sp. As11 TaxID=3029189 RepID=UPI003B7B152C